MKKGQIINRIFFKCDYCGTATSDVASSYKRKKQHFCKRACYGHFMKTRPKEEHPAFKFQEALRAKRAERQEKPKPFAAPLPLEKRFCPVCPGKYPLGHCWGDVNAAEGA